MAQLPSRVLLFGLCLALALAGCGDETDEFGTGGDDDDASTGDDDTTGGDDDSADDDTGDDDDSADDDDDSADDDDTTEGDPYVEPEVFVVPQEFEPGDLIEIQYLGQYAAEDALDIRYGFDGYTRIDSIGEEWLSEAVDGSTRYFLEAPMVQGVDRFTFELEVPLDARAIHMTFYVTDEDEERTYDDREGLGYHQQVVFPYIGPLLSWTDQAAPGTGVVVTFETSMPCRGTVEYGPTVALGQSALGDGVDHVHHVRLEGLTPDSDVYYRVLDNVGHASEVFGFHTPPLVDAGPWRFAVIADAQDHGDGIQAWAAVAPALLAEHPDLSLLLFTGDLTAVDETGDWWTFFDVGRPLFEGLPLLPAVGNHDVRYGVNGPDESTFERYFPHPEASPDGFVHRVDVRNAALLTLDSQWSEGFDEGGDQRLWIEQQLADIAAAGEPHWVFAQWHVPVYDAGVRTSASAQEELRGLTATFEGNVDWVFTGHEHMGQRMLPLQYDGVLAPSGAYGRGPDDGVGYIVLPPAGMSPRTSVVAFDGPSADQRDWPAFPVLDPETNTTESELGWLLVTLDGDNLTLDMYGTGQLGAPVAPYVRDGVSYTRP